MVFAEPKERALQLAAVVSIFTDNDYELHTCKHGFGFKLIA